MATVFPVSNGVPEYSGIAIPEIYSLKESEVFYANTVMTSIANTDYEGEIKNQGDKVTIRKVSGGSVQKYVAGQNLNYETILPESQQLLIDQALSTSFMVDDVMDKQFDIPWVTRYAEHYGQLKQIEIDKTVLQGIYASAATGNSGLTAGASSGKVSLGVTGTPIELTTGTVVTKMLECAQVLDEQNVPTEGRWIVVPPWVATRVFGSDLKGANLTGDTTSPLRNRMIGEVAGFKVYVSQNLKDVTDTVKCYYIPFGTKSAITFASQLTSSDKIKSPNTFGWLYRTLTVFGYKVVTPEALGILYAKPG